MKDTKCHGCGDDLNPAWIRAHNFSNLCPHCRNWIERNREEFERLPVDILRHVLRKARTS